MNKLFHDEKAEQINWLDNRYYTNDGEVFFPSVTEILSVFPKGMGFHQWLKDVGHNATQIADKAAAAGSKVHEATEFLNNGVELTWANQEGKEHYTLEEWRMILRYAEFWKEANPKLLANEAKFCSSRLGYGGTLDRVVEINNKRWLLDIKTSNYIHKPMELQLAAYAYMWNEFNPDHQIDETGVVWLKASTRTSKIDLEKGIFQGKGWQLKTFSRSYQDAFKIFLHTQALWKEENPKYKPSNTVYPDRIKL